MISTKNSAKAMKAVFKKYLSFEQFNGTQEHVEGVKVKARDYVSSIM
jgi:hypothetical protein